MTVKLTPTQLALLCIIDKATLRVNGQVTSYWWPHDRTEYYTALNGTLVDFYVYGAGVVASLKSLDAKGLTEKPRCGERGHARQVTEAGRNLVEKLRSAYRDPVPE